MNRIGSIVLALAVCVMAATMDEILRDPVLLAKYTRQCDNIAHWRDKEMPVDSVTLKSIVAMLKAQRDTLKTYCVDTVRHCNYLDTLVKKNEKLLDDWRSKKIPYPNVNTGEPK
jgi:hypothetical protein